MSEKDTSATSIHTLPLPAGSPVDRAGPVALDAIAGISPDLERLGHYPVLGLLGTGGMGEVYRVLDPHLNRPMALKVLKEEWSHDSLVVSRFIEEAQATSQLQHPSIVSVHNLGQLPDGRWFFTMQEVQGRTLKELITQVHAASFERWTPTQDGWSFRRLVDAFHSVCEAVAYAHDRGVIHRDLKPSNILLGDSGQVLVVDWGIAKVKGRPDLAHESGIFYEPVRTSRSGDTMPGAIAGAPAFMPPEQARGETSAIDERSDVYSLGCILFQLLWGRRPYKEVAPEAVLSAVLKGPPRTPVDGVPKRPDPLKSICAKAMATDPIIRFASGRELSAAVASWLDGSRLHAQALEEVEGASTLNREAAEFRHQARGIARRADRMLSRLEPWAGEEAKAGAWAQQALARSLEQTAEARQVEAQSRLQGALAHSPDLPEAHAALAALYRERHEESERRRDEAQALRAEALLRAHAMALPVSSAVRAGHERYLQGDGRLSLRTSPPGAQARLFRYTMNRQRLVPEFVRELGQTPLLEVPVAQGSWLVELSHPERAKVRYPLQISRLQHWQGVPPGARSAYAVDLPFCSQLGPDDIYVPAGWFLRGGDPDAPNSLPQDRIWLDAYVMQRFPVTNRRYLRFLNDLIQRGREEEATQHVPRERSGLRRAAGTQLYARDANGLFQLAEGQRGDWKLNWPVLMVDWSGASAYARWYRNQTGLPWRLPMSDEWSKSARGVDGRFYPWGDSFDPSWCAMRDSVHESKLAPVAVGSYPVDESPFGVRDMAGSAKDWCLDGMRGGRRAVRGGFWRGDEMRARVSSRQEYDPSTRTRHLSFRLARPFPMTNT